jgi:hypothetical protein
MKNLNIKDIEKLGWGLEIYEIDNDHELFKAERFSIGDYKLELSVNHPYLIRSIEEKLKFIELSWKLHKNYSVIFNGPIVYISGLKKIMNWLKIR